MKIQIWFNDYSNIFFHIGNVSNHEDVKIPANIKGYELQCEKLSFPYLIEVEEYFLRQTN